MSKHSIAQRLVAILTPALFVLAACGSPKTTTTASTEPRPPGQDPVQTVVRELLAHQAAGRVRTVGGVGFVQAPIAVFLAHGQVSLIPSTPEVESALAGLQRRWLAGRRKPLPYEAFQAAFRRLTAHRWAVGRAGGEALIRFAETDERGQFTLQEVPEGRWLLVADMNSPVSTLLWVVPVEVGAQDPPPVFLVEGNLLLEARKDTPPASAP